MKLLSRIACFMVVGILCAPFANAQYGAARRLAERAAGSGGGSPAAPAPPARPAAPPSPASKLQVVPARPVDPAKAAAEKDAALQRVIANQKERAENGSPSAQYDLGMRYLTGDGVEQDVPTAKVWLKKSADQKNDDAKKKLVELEEAEAAAAKEKPKP